MNILETAPISTVRRNHGIEHATVHILSADDSTIQLVGRADTTGFNIYGDVDTETLNAAAHQAVQRLQNGEGNLAVHPRCGTNLAVAGLLSALAAIIALGRKPSLRKLPDVFVATTIAAFLAQPVGMAMQARVTTSPDARGARITGIRQSQMGRVQVQHVDVEWS
jgi:hypothetical protein